MIENKVPPNDQDLEVLVLGSCLLEKEGCKKALELLHEDVFYNDGNSIVFKAIKNIDSKKDPVDIMTITRELMRTKGLNSIGGAHRISTLTNSVASASNIETHCRILLQLYFKRELIKISGEMIKRGYDDFHDVFDMIDFLKKKIKDLESNIVSDAVVDNNQVIDQVLIDIEDAASKNGITGLSTGLKSLDIGIMGLKKKFKYLIAAQAGEGKTALAKTIAVNLSHVQGKPGVFFSLEVTREMFMIGCISEILSIPNQFIQTGQISEIDKSRIRALKNTLFTNALIIDDRGGLSPEEINITLKKLKESHKIEWFVIDYINLQKIKGKESKGKSKEERVAEIVNENKNMAKEHDLICIELAQFTKEISKREGGRPHIGDLKDTGALEQSSDVVILVYRPENHDLPDYHGLDSAGLAELIIAKNKWGKKKDLLATYEGEYTKFSDHSAGNEFVPTKEYNTEEGF